MFDIKNSFMWLNGVGIDEILSLKMPDSRSERLTLLEYLNRVTSSSQGGYLPNGLFKEVHANAVFSSYQTPTIQQSLNQQIIRLEFDRTTLILDSAVDAILIPTLLCIKATITTVCPYSGNKIFIRFGTEKAMSVDPAESIVLLREKTSDNSIFRAVRVQDLFLAATRMKRTLFSDNHFMRVGFISNEKK